MLRSAIAAHRDGGGDKQMRKVLMAGFGGLLVTACAAQPNVPPVVSWSYGAGNGDPVQYQGPAPAYSFANGLGADVPVSSGGKPTVQYGYGAENQQGTMVQMQPSAPASQQVAAPAATGSPAPAPGSHS
jgi:hypothetical protein